MNLATYNPGGRNEQESLSASVAKSCGKGGEVGVERQANYTGCQTESDAVDLEVLESHDETGSDGLVGSIFVGFTHLLCQPRKGHRHSRLQPYEAEQRSARRR